MQAFLKRKAAALKISGVEFDGNGKVLAHRLADSTDAFHQKARTIFQTAAPVIVTLVAARAKELRDQIAMRRMDLNAGKACVLGRLCRNGKTLDQIFNFSIG